jgi:small subunit ribosomal protein S21
LVKVEKRPGESPEQLLKRFRRQVARSKIMSEVRRRRWHLSKSEVRRLEKKKAIRRIRRRKLRNRNYR